MNYQIHEFSNKFTLVYKPINSTLAHFAVFNECGSRHEQSFPFGISHFVEHMLFKGTNKKKTYHILSGLENIGCDVNAFTSKEELVLHASFLEEYSPKIFSLFSEMIYESTFPEAEVEKERNVILDEIRVVKDNPTEFIVDKFENLIFENHPLSRDILGSTFSLKKINKKQLHNFYKEVFLPSRKVIVYFGNKPFNKIKFLIEKFFIQKEYEYGRIAVNNAFLDHNCSKFFKIEKKSNHQTHVVLGAKAYSILDNQRVAFGLLINLLGGQAFNSRLNLSVREKYGLSYLIDAYYNIFKDNGYFSINFSCDSCNTQKILEVINKELKLLRENKIGTLQLHNAKKQIIGQTAVYLDSQSHDLISSGKSYLHASKIPSFAEIREKIENITSLELNDISNEMFQTDNLSYLIFNSKTNGKH